MLLWSKLDGLPRRGRQSMRSAGWLRRDEPNETQTQNGWFSNKNERRCRTSPKNLTNKHSVCGLWKFFHFWDQDLKNILHIDWTNKHLSFFSRLHNERTLYNEGLKLSFCASAKYCRFTEGIKKQWIDSPFFIKAGEFSWMNHLGKN